MKIEIELPKIEGFEYTGEFRRPRGGEYYLSKRLLREVIAVSPPKYGCHILKDIKPKELTLEEKVKAKYPDYKVVMLEWDIDNTLSFRISHPSSNQAYHACAQSMKGFYRYVYQHPHYDWDTCTIPTMQWAKDETIQPVAVLFTRDK